MNRAEAQEWLVALKADVAKANSIFSKEWEEAKHPRGAGGKFGSGEGSSSESTKVVNGYEIKPGANLRNADLRFADLHSADLRNADLRGLNLKGADLRDANLAGAKLSDANLRGANLRDANLSGADLRNVYLSDTDLRGADLSHANLDSAKLNAANLSDASLVATKLSDANLSNADLRDANLAAAKLSDANLAGANLRDANLSGADLSGAWLNGADLSGARFNSTNLSNAELAGADLRNAFLSNADLGDANLAGANLFEANLDGANLIGANLEGANLNGAVGVPAQYKKASRTLSKDWAKWDAEHSGKSDDQRAMFNESAASNHRSMAGLMHNGAVNTGNTPAGSKYAEARDSHNTAAELHRQAADAIRSEGASSGKAKGLEQRAISQGDKARESERIATSGSRARATVDSLTTRTGQSAWRG